MDDKITIDLDQDTMDALSRRAQEHGRSVDEEAADIAAKRSRQEGGGPRPGRMGAQYPSNDAQGCTSDRQSGSPPPRQRSVIVVNTSLALQWVLAEPDTDRASSLLTDVGALASSDVLFIETANVLGKKVRHSEIPMEQAREGLLFIRANVPTIVPGVDLVARALELSVAISHPVYDCIFLACAERLGCPLATRDRPFAKRLTEGGFGALLAGPVA